jgi:hypothetical protein
MLLLIMPDALKVGAVAAVWLLFFLVCLGMPYDRRENL